MSKIVYFAVIDGLKQNTDVCSNTWYHAIQKESIIVITSDERWYDNKQL